jgi:cardiolipin synthase A/B
MTLLLSTLILLQSNFAMSSQCGHLYGEPTGDIFQTKIDQLTHTTKSSDNEVINLADAVEDYQKRIELREQAKRFIHLYTLFIEDNKTGLESAAHLVKKSQLDNVEVNLIYSPVAQISTSPKIITGLRNMGINVRPYFPKNAQGVVYQTIYGAHKKALIVDSKKYGIEAIVGGRNIGDNYFANIPDDDKAGFPNIWKDSDILIRGSVLHELVDDYIYSFNRHSWKDDKIIECNNGKSQCDYYPKVTTSENAILSDMRLLENEPDENKGKGIFEINDMYAELLAQARYTVDIQTPYFIPQAPLLDKLHEALSNGVKVRILTNSIRGNDLGTPLFYASAYYWKKLIENGAEIYLWDLPESKVDKEIRRTMHSKIITVDDCITMPGSWNFDGRSYAWENEYAFPIYNPLISQQSTELLNEELALNGIVQVDKEWLETNFTSWDYIKAFFYSKLLSKYL